MIRVLPVNETYVKVMTDDFGIDQELSDFFTFFAPGYRFTPKYRSGQWDGKIRLFNMRTRMIYKGLLDFIVKFAKNGNYELQIDESLNNKTGITYEEVSDFVDSLRLQARGEDLSVREYQYEAIHKGLGEYRSLMLSPTSSGKSLIIYCIIRHLMEHDDEMNILLIVPNTLLVEQFFSDMKDYSTANGWDVEANAQLLYSGKEKLFSKRIMITTWQSLTSMMKNQPDYFNDIVRRTKAAIFDEAHSYKANVVLSTMEKFIHTKHRIGTTGTLDDSKINELSLRGLMGPTYKVISTKELMDAGQISKLKIKCLVLQYPEHLRKELKGIDYQNEINFIVANEKRNKIIRDLALSCKGNTLILFNYVERHGKVIFDLINAKIAEGRKVYFVFGGTEAGEREEIRRILDSEKDAIVVAGTKIFSTGANIPSIENVIFAMPSKSTITIRQSIGRGLRLRKGKTHMTLFDISDDLSYKNFRNSGMKHLEERVSIYTKEQFEYQFINIPL